MENILYFKNNLPSWIKSLIKGVKPRDVVEVLKEREDNMILIYHEASDYQGWMSRDNFTENPEEIVVTGTIQKVKWDLE